MRESLFDAYFGDRADEVFCKDEQKDIWQLGETMNGDFYKYETVLGGQVFTLRYSVPNLNPLDDNRKGYGEVSGCTITAEEAVRLCDELIAGMTDPGNNAGIKSLIHNFSFVYIIYRFRVYNRLLTSIS